MTFNSKHCAVCGKEPAPRAKYCPRCKKHVGSRENCARAMALKAAYSPEQDGFLCGYTGLRLEEDDTSNPWYLCYDHRTPRKKGDLAVCARWANNMKSQLTAGDFRAVVLEFARCRTAGEPFNTRIADFKEWIGPVNTGSTRLANDIDLSLPKIGDCVICARRTVPHSKYCPRCRPIVRQGDISERTEALKAAYDGSSDGFRCYYGGMVVEETDVRSPFFITLDHRIPKKPGTLAVAAALFNLMKTDLSDTEFVAVMTELAKHLGTGAEFDREVVRFEYWHRE